MLTSQHPLCPQQAAAETQLLLPVYARSVPGPAWLTYYMPMKAQDKVQGACDIPALMQDPTQRHSSIPGPAHFVKSEDVQGLQLIQPYL